MAISKNSVRIQFTLNKNKEKEKLIIEFLDGCIDPNSSMKEIIYNYIVSNSGTKLPQVTLSKNNKSEDKLLTVTKSDSIKLDINNIVTQSEKELPGVSELELNELEELKKFV